MKILDDVAGKGTFVSRSQAFASGYKGVLFEFQLNPGTLKQFEKIGVRNEVSNAAHPFSNLPLVTSGWKSENAFFKFETNRRGLSEVNIGLGNGRALDIFNANITNFRKISP